MTMHDDDTIPIGDRWRWWALPPSALPEAWVDVVGLHRVDGGVAYFVRTIEDRRIACGTATTAYSGARAARDDATRCGHRVRAGLAVDDTAIVPAYFGHVGDPDIEVVADVVADAVPAPAPPPVNPDDRVIAAGADPDDVATPAPADVAAARAALFAAPTAEQWWAMYATTLPTVVTIRQARTTAGHTLYLVIDATCARLALGTHREGYASFDAAMDAVRSLRGATGAPRYTETHPAPLVARLPDWYEPIGDAPSPGIDDDFMPAPRPRRRRAVVVDDAGTTPPTAVPPPGMVPSPILPYPAPRWWDRDNYEIPWYALDPDPKDRHAFTAIRVLRHSDGRELYLVQNVVDHRVAYGTNRNGYATEAEARAASRARGDIVYARVLTLHEPIPRDARVTPWPENDDLKEYHLPGTE